MPTKSSEILKELAAVFFEVGDSVLKDKIAITDSDSTWSHYQKLANWIEHHYFLRFLAWIIFLPRFLLNITGLIANTIGHPWLNEELKNMSMLQRAKHQCKNVA